eukprot:gnl/TRDRNA2_/TRDRNA2_191149_c0_seq1.p1 gnl/TRDRNA2_/TRDRNA2_191149_c0~~gnl/TRDRNA2_/TRDRNA2_191149_c0_seq1.p1  ORF type:complete len:255 (-),score=36.62 gnl/TRDRNA2_/TRDRNA2_191149_c0_seq1:87-851(-)
MQLVRRFTVVILTATVVTAQAKEPPSNARRKLVDRRLHASVYRRTDLDTAMLGKPGHLSLSVNPRQAPVASGRWKPLNGDSTSHGISKLTYPAASPRPTATRAILSDADVAAVGAIATSSAVVLGAYNFVGTRLNRAVDQRNLELMVATKLREKQQQILAGDGDTKELQAQVEKLKRLQAELKTEADEGNAVQGPMTAPQLTPDVYLMKSIESLMRIRSSKASIKESSLQSAVFALVLLLLAWILVGLVAPSQT